jgi:hypothetical protein
MIDNVSNTRLRELAARRGPHCVSIYLPNHRSGR